MRLVLRTVDGCAVPGGRALLLADEDGSVLPGQTALVLEQEENGRMLATVTFEVDGLAVALDGSPVEEEE